jgi:tRNA(Ile)-lysidine synthetase-like protein
VNLARWRALPLALKRRTLRYAVYLLHRSLRDLSFRTVELARKIVEEGSAGSAATLPGDMELLVEYDSWRLALPSADVPPSGPQLDSAQPQPFSVPGTMVLANGWRLRSAYVDDSPGEVDYQQWNPWRAYLDAERAGALLVRGRREGERFRPLGLAGHSVQVSDFMINEKIAGELRARWPIVANEAHVLWIVGQRIDERAKVTAETRRILQLHCFRHSTMVGEKGDLLE